MPFPNSKRASCLSAVCQRTERALTSADKR
jgi:hypothetical protein